MWWREVPLRWWAVLIGIAFGSLALVALDGPKKGYGRVTVMSILCAPLLAVVSGAMLPPGTTLEIAALVGGVTALGGIAVIAAIAKMAPGLVTAGLTGIARSYLQIEPTPPGEHPKVTRLREDGTPAEPDEELERLARKIGEKGKSDD